MRISAKNTTLGVTSTQSGHARGSEFSPSVADFMPSCQGQSLGKSMSEIEKMKRYIARTNMNPEKASLYQMSMLEAFELAKQTNGSFNLSIEMISLAFNYGKAKGYRAAKAEVR